MTTTNLTPASVPDVAVPSFSDLGIPSPLVAVLATSGITSPFPIQAATIPDVLVGRDVAGQAATGSGKTLSYMLPTLVRITGMAVTPKAPLVLVLCPTRELAEQVVEVTNPIAQTLQLSATLVVGGLSVQDQIDSLAAGSHIVVATPGRAIDLIERQALSLDGVKVVIIDEADRMSDMGFMPQVEWLIRHTPKARQTLVFSATLEGAASRLMKAFMTDPVRHELESSNRAATSITHRFVRVHEMDKAKVAAAICSANTRTLVFCTTKRQVDRTERELKKLGVKCLALHGDLPQAQRSAAVAAFTAGKVSALVATDVASRGLDIDDIDVVVHYDPASDTDSYVHRSGRTGRAGRTGLAVTLMLYNEENIVRVLQRRLDLVGPLPELFSNDPRLAHLGNYTQDELCERPVRTA